LINEGTVCLKCGDSIVQPTEECDDGNDNENDECAECKLNECGDGFLHTDVEECDDGDKAPNDGCDEDCLIECGNGVKEPLEDCDFRREEDIGKCTSECTWIEEEEIDYYSFCGNGRRDYFETCDDGLHDTHGCNKHCNGTHSDWLCWGGSETQKDICVKTCNTVDQRDFVIHYQREDICDDGNTENGDGCDRHCMVEPNYICYKFLDDFDKCISTITSRD